MKARRFPTIFFFFKKNIALENSRSCRKTPCFFFSKFKKKQKLKFMQLPPKTEHKHSKLFFVASFFFVVVLAIITDYNVSDEPRSIKGLEKIYLHATSLFEQPLFASSNELKFYTYKQMGSRFVLSSLPRDNLINDGICPDIQLNYCQMRALDAHLSENSFFSARIKKLEAQLDGVLQKLKLFAEEVDPK